MDRDMLRLRAHIDQTRSEMRAVVRGFESDRLARIVKTCAAGRLDELDDTLRLLVGLLAVVSIFDLAEASGDSPASDRKGD